MGALKLLHPLAVPPQLALAETKIGIQEILNGKVNPFVTECFTYTTYKTKQNEAWCAAFICYLLRNTGFKDTNNAGAASYDKYGTAVAIADAQPGDIVTFRWASGDRHVSMIHHVVDADNVACLGGNQSNQVKISVYAKHFIAAVRRPVPLSGAAAPIPAPVNGSAPSPSAFEQALAYTFPNEGGYSDSPIDRGGPTNFGITIADLSKWRGHKCTADDVKNMNKIEARAIYQAWYWTVNSLDKLASPALAIAIFDIGVVCGTHTAAKIAQASCNHNGSHLVLDGDIGPQSIAALNGQNRTGFIREFSNEVEARFRAIAAGDSTQQGNLAGWVNRAHRLLTLA